MEHDETFYKKLLIEALLHQGVEVTFENLAGDSPNEIVEKSCFQALQKIWAVLDDDSLQDFECIEQIFSILEGIGARGCLRNDC